ELRRAAFYPRCEIKRRGIRPISFALSITGQPRVAGQAAVARRTGETAKRTTAEKRSEAAAVENRAVVSAVPSGYKGQFRHFPSAAWRAGDFFELAPHTRYFHHRP